MTDAKPTKFDEERAHGEVIARRMGRKDAKDRDVDRALRDPTPAYC